MFAADRDETMSAALAMTTLSAHHNEIIEEQGFQIALLTQEISALSLMLRDHKESCEEGDYVLANHVMNSLYGLVGLQNHSSN